MKYFKATNYALHALLFMIKNNGDVQRIPVQDLAKALGISTTYLSKILTRLVKAGVISASSGAKGGYQLSLKWQDVTIYEVITTIDGKQSLFEDSFNHGDSCPINKLMIEAEQALIGSLKQKKLKDLI